MKGLFAELWEGLKEPRGNDRALETGNSIEILTSLGPRRKRKEQCFQELVRAVAMEESLPSGGSCHITTARAKER